MRNLFKMAGVFCLLMLVVAVAVPLLPSDVLAVPLTWHDPGLLLFMGAVGHRIVALTPERLREASEATDAQQGESVPWIIYDSQTYTSGTTTTLTFFGAAQADRTLSNMPNGGIFPAKQFFEIYNLGLDVLADATTAAGGETGAVDDINKLMLVGRPHFTFDLSQKIMGQFPLSFLHTSGGFNGIGYGTFTAEESIQAANNSFPDGGWNWYGSVIIPPQNNFNIVTTWNAAQTLAIGNTVLRLWMCGTLHRRVL